MENRILINGVWYVKEECKFTETKASPNIDDMIEELTTSLEIVYENSDFCFVASRIYETKKIFYDDFTITITDKRSGDKSTWKEEYMDHMLFMDHLKDRNPESIDEMCKTMNMEGVEILITFLNILEKKGWFKGWSKSF